MKKTGKRIVSMLLISLLMISVFPTAAFAESGKVAQVGTEQYDSLQEAIDAAGDNETVELLCDVVLDASENNGDGALLSIGSSLTLDGKDFTISAKGIKDEAGVNILSVGEGANVILKNLTIDGGEVQGDYIQPKAQYIIELNNANITFNDVELANSDDYDILSKGATMILNGLKAQKGLLVDNGSNLTVNDGDLGVIQFTKTDPSGEKSVAVVNGGYLAGFGEAGLGSDGNATDTVLTINGGCFSQVSGKSDRTPINIGSEEYRNKYVANGATLEKIVYDEYTYSGGTSEFYYYRVTSPDDKAVAVIGDTEYTNLQDAVYAAEDGETIALQGNIEVGNSFDLPKVYGDYSAVGTKKIVIDGNGYTISSKYAYNHDWNILSSSGDGTPGNESRVNLTLKNIVLDGAVRGQALLKGCDIAGTNLTFDQVTIKNIQGNGMDVRNADVALTNSTSINNTTGYAVETHDSANLTVNSLLTSGNAKGGLYVGCYTDKTTLTIADAEIKDSTSISLLKGTTDTNATIDADISGGKFEFVFVNAPEGYTDDIDLEITGGTFKTNAGFDISTYLPDGYVFDTSAASDGYGQVVKEGEQPTTPPEEESGLEVILGNTTLQEGTYYLAGTDGSVTESSEDSYNVYYKDNTLYMNNMNYRGDGHYIKYGEAALSVIGDVTLELTGQNTVDNTEDGGFYGMYVEGDLTITGNGDLTIQAPDAIKDGNVENMLPTGTIGLDIIYGSLILNGSGTVTATGGDIKADYVQSYGISVYTDRAKDGGDIILNGPGTLKGIGGSGDGTHEKNFSYGLTANSANVTNGGTLEGTGGTTPDRDGDENYQDSSSTGMNVAYVKADNGTINATGGKSQRSWGLYSESGFERDGFNNKLELINNSSLVASADGNRTSIGAYYSASLYDTFFIENSSLIADSGAESATDSLYAMYAKYLDETLNKENLMWRYESGGSYIANNIIVPDKHAYLEIRALDSEQIEDPEEPSDPGTPSEPSTPSRPSTPSEPENPDADVSTDDSADTTITTAKPSVITDGTSASAAVSEEMGEAIVEQATTNESNTVVIAPEMDTDVDDASVSIPAATVAALGENTNADFIISTPVADITLPNGALSDIAADSEEVKVSVVASDNTVSIEVADDNGALASVNGGIKVAIPTSDTTSGTVAVIVHADGTREVVRKSVVADDTLIVPLNGSATIEITDNSKEFDDVSANAWYSDAVAFASSHELFNGTSATEFSPDAGMTRGMLAAVLSNLERGDGSGLTSAFDDVDENAWYADAVAWAADNGIINGYGNNTFGPDDLITREQMAAMLYNYAEMLGYDTSASADLNSYSDSASVSSWAEDVMRWANAEGLINGTSATTLDPQGTATRAQVAAMLERFVIMLAE